MCELASTYKGWHAKLFLGFTKSKDRTQLSKRLREGPLVVQRPFYPEGDTCHVYLLHPPGGVVGGDSLEIEADLALNSEALITTPGATKFYRSAGPLAHQTQKITLAPDSCLEWFPQENIFFSQAQAKLRTDVYLQGNARLAFWEIHCFGLPSAKEEFIEGAVDASLSIWRDDEPILLERLRLNSEMRSKGSLSRGLPVMATFVISHADEQALAKVRTLLEANEAAEFAVTLLNDLLVVRYLGHSTDLARTIFITIWFELRLALLAKPNHMPRIWNT